MFNKCNRISIKMIEIMFCLLDFAKTDIFNIPYLSKNLVYFFICMILLYSFCSCLTLEFLEFKPGVFLVQLISLLNPRTKNCAWDIIGA